MRRLAAILLVLCAAAAAWAIPAGGAEDTNVYDIEMYNAFGVVEGSDVRIAGVNAGTVQSLDVNEEKRAVVTVELTGPLAVLGEDTQCTSEPQSLIAEYYIDCTPKGEPIDTSGEGPDIPASQVAQTVQPDLAQSMFRAPYVDRLQILINEFGTALAGNSESLNEAIRLGAPALTETRKVTSILAKQNTIIRDLNVNSDRVIARLAANREDVVRFIDEAEDTARISASRGEDLQHNFDRLDDFLAELEPTLVRLRTLAREQQPLLTDLRASAPQLNELAVSLPAFNRATEVSLDSLGEASQVGEVALRRGRDEISELADSGRNAAIDGEMLADLLRDLDDPSRAVERDTRSDRTCQNKSRPCYSTGRKGGGYTGAEGLFNYAYYQTLTINQVDKFGHLLHLSLYSIGPGESGPARCNGFNTFRNPDNGRVEFPTEGGGTEPVGNRSAEDVFTDPDLSECVAWLGPNQPGITENVPLPDYDPSVCRDGVEPAARNLCNPPGPGQRTIPSVSSAAAGGVSDGSFEDSGQAPESLPGLPDTPLPDQGLEDLLPGPGGNGGGGGAPDPGDALDDVGELPNDLLDRKRRNRRGGGGMGGGAQQLLDYLFQD